MYFLHAPKLVLTGSSPSLRETADRAAALGAEVVVVDPASVADPARITSDDAVPVLVELDGFDVALVVIADVASACDDLLPAASLLGPGLRNGALVIVSSAVSVESAGRVLAAGLGERAGLEAGRHFDVVGVEGDDVAWSTGDEGAETARYLVARLRTGVPVLHG